MGNANMGGNANTVNVRMKHNSNNLNTLKMRHHHAHHALNTKTVKKNKLWNKTLE
jgi:hypothetical protein